MKDAILVNPSSEIRVNMLKAMEKSITIQQAIEDQLFKSTHMLTFTKLFQLAPNLKQYVLSKLHTEQNLVPH